MYKLTAAILLLPAFVLASPMDSEFLENRQANSPPLEQITITNTSTSGNGCPQGSVSTSITPDKTVVTFGFDAMQAYIGPGALQADKTKNCQIHLNLKYPGGFQYAVVDATYHGYARLDPAVTGNFLSSYYFSQAAADTASTKSSISGKQWLTGNLYTKQDLIESTATIWSPCGDTGILNVNNRIALTTTDPKQTGELTNDDATIAFTQQLHVSWKKCTPGAGGGGGGWTIGPGSTETVKRAEEKAERAEETAESTDPPPVWTIGPGGTILTPGGNSGGGGGGSWTIGPGGTIIIPGKNKE